MNRSIAPLRSTPRAAKLAILVAALTASACSAKQDDSQGNVSSSTAKAPSSAAPSAASKASSAPSGSSVADKDTPSSGVAPSKSADSTAGAGKAGAAKAGSLKLFGRPAKTASLKLDKTSFATGDAINVTFAAPLDPPEGQQYWLTLVKAGAPDSEYGDWHYVSPGATSDTLKARAAGDYEVRLHDLYPANGYKVMAREKVSVKCETGDCGAVAPPPPPEKPQVTTDGYLADGWPAEIPARGSKAPSVDEWNAVTKEVTVWHSSELKCETKVVREWLRVSCHKNAYGKPSSVTKTTSDGQQSFTLANDTVASLVVELVPGKSYTANFAWENATFEFVLTWPNGGRPQAFFAK